MSQRSSSVVSSKKGSIIAVDEKILVDHTRRDRDVLFLASRVGKTQIAVSRFLFLDQLDDVGGAHGRLRISCAIGSRSPSRCKSRAIQQAVKNCSLINALRKYRHTR